MIKYFSAALFVGALATSATADTVDFESFVGADPTNVGSGWTFEGITFGSDQGIFVVGSGAPQNAFVPDDTVAPAGQFGEWFLTNDFSNGKSGGNGNAHMSMAFGTNLTSISFDVADIDGVGTQEESFTVQYLLGGSIVGALTETVSASALGLADGGVYTFSASGLFDEVIISGVSAGGNNRNIGWGLDNIETAPVPLPAGGLLLLGGLAGFAALRRRKGAAA